MKITLEPKNGYSILHLHGEFDGGGLTAVAIRGQDIFSAGREGGCIWWRYATPEPGKPKQLLQVKALREVYAHFHGGGSAAELKDRIASAKEMDALVFGEDYKKYIRDFLN